MSQCAWRVRWLLHKEFGRLKRNASAAMAVGLMILVALLIRVDGERSRQEGRADTARASICLVVYWTRDALVEYLIANPPASPRVRLVQANERTLHAERPLRYPPQVGCVAELRPPESSEGRHSLTYLSPKGDRARLFDLRSWLHESARQVFQLPSVPIVERGVRDLHKVQVHSGTAQGPFASVDFSARKDALVGAMLLFSVQYFVCCGLFVSFAAFEKERGILQALALTPTTTGEILLAKYIFHLVVALVACTAIALLLGVPLAWLPFLAPYFILSCLGFLAIATIIVSLTRTQTSASLISFCYLLVVGALFGLSKHFAVFGLVRSGMFESYTFLINFFAFGRSPGELIHALGYAGVPLAVLSIVLIVFAVLFFRRQGCR